MKYFFLYLVMLFSILANGQITKPATSQPASKVRTSQPSIKEAATERYKKATSQPTQKPTSTQPNKSVAAKVTTPTSFTDGSPYIDMTPYMNSISAEDMRKHLTIIASDEFEGRETGTKGNKMAANYIAEQFANMNLPRIGDAYSYFQNVSFIKESWEKLSVMANDETLRNMNDFFAFPSTNSDMPRIQSDEIVFLGYGIEDTNYSDYSGKNVQDKVLLIYNGEPKNAAGNFYVSKSKETSKWSDFREKIKTAHQKGAKLVLIIDADIRKTIGENRNTLLSSRLQLGDGEQPKGKYANNIFISPGMAQKLIGRKFNKVVKARKKIQAKGKSKLVKLSTKLDVTMQKLESKLKGENVVGYIEGTDPVLKEEIVVVSAHYDHLGKRGDDVFNGADDNGSGTTTALEIAEAFSMAKQAGKGPRRSVVVMLVTGEEKGLLGSKYYVEYPTFKLENTVVDINVDMVGRVDEKHADDPNYIYVIGADRLSTELHEINEAANKNFTQLELDYTYNAESDPNRYYYRSDHYNFAEKGIPAIFYFNGTHDDYHMITDTVEKINFEKMERIGRLVFATAWELANRDKRIEVDVIE